MQIPDCYDPVFSAERREMEKDKLVERLERCALCDDVLYPGAAFRETHGKCVCEFCFEQLEDNKEIVEIEYKEETV